MSFIKEIDENLKTLIYTKFGEDLGLNSSSTPQNTSVVLEPRDVALRKIAEKRGQNSVEFISIWREGVHKDRERMNTPVARRGFYLEYTDGERTDITTVKAIPIKIDYSIRFWSRNFDKVTNAVERYLFWQQADPNLTFNYQTNYPLEMDILTVGDVYDESSIVSQYNVGLYFVNKVDITLDGWIFDSFDTKTIKTIILNVYLRETVNGENVDTLLRTYTTSAED